MRPSPTKMLPARLPAVAAAAGVCCGPCQCAALRCCGGCQTCRRGCDCGCGCMAGAASHCDCVTVSASNPCSLQAGLYVAGFPDSHEPGLLLVPGFLDNRPQAQARFTAHMHAGKDGKRAGLCVTVCTGQACTGMHSLAIAVPSTHLPRD